MVDLTFDCIFRDEIDPDLVIDALARIDGYWTMPELRLVLREEVDERHFRFCSNTVTYH
jgi:hypothetical protein